MRRKRPEDRSAEWRPRRDIRVFLDDVDELFGVLESLGGAVSGETDEFADIKSAEELRNSGVSVLRDLTMRATVGHRLVEVRIGSPTAVRISSRDDNDLVGVLQRASDVLSRCESLFGVRELVRPAQFLPLLVLGAGVFFVLLGSRLFPGSDEPTASTPWWLVVPLATSFVVFGVLIPLWSPRTGNPRAVVILKTKAEAPSFWERNRSAILINVVTNVVVALSFFLLGLALQ